MKPFDPNKKYLGPEGHWLSEFIPPHPPSVPELYDLWNRASYNHDKGYEGEEYSGWFGWIKKFFNRIEAETERSYVDEQFETELIRAIELLKKELTREQVEIAYAYTAIVYKAVRKFGWSFYKTGAKE